MISTNRIEAFSDGVIAIIITVMIFDLKLTEIPTTGNVLEQLLELVPKFLCYIFSFLMLGIMWVNHHQLFHQVEQTDRWLLWYNLQLLFWMSLIPFVTNMVGQNPALPWAYCFYSVVFASCALSFAFLRHHLVRKRLLHRTIHPVTSSKLKRKNLIAVFIYLVAGAGAFLSVYLSIFLLLVVPILYFLPQKIEHHSNNI